MLSPPMYWISLVCSVSMALIISRAWKVRAVLDVENASDPGSVLMLLACVVAFACAVRFGPEHFWKPGDANEKR